jgi:CubicO group peptidase (beta-lactamase class C family)
MRASIPALFLAITGIVSSAPPAATQGAMTDGANAKTLEELHGRIVSGDLSGIHGVLVVRDGRMLAEWYFAGEDQHRGMPVGRVAFTADTLHDLRSVTKTVVALLVGVAVGEGKIASIDAPVLDFFPEYADLRTPERMKIRLVDLLSMSAGLAWDEDSFPYTDLRNSETAMDAAPDRYRYALEQSIASPPGIAFKYSGGNVALMAEVLRRASGTSLEDYAQEKLFGPLHITEHEWYKDRSGTLIAASGLRLKPRDMVKIGELMLDGGRFGGHKIVPASWIEATTTPKLALAPEPCAMRYGYFTWISPGCIADPPAPWFAGMGNGGQRIWVVPTLRLVVVLTEGLYDQPSSRNTNAVLRAALGQAPEPAPPR